MTKEQAEKNNIAAGLILMLLIVIGIVFWYLDGERKKLRGGFKLSKTNWNISKFLEGKQQAGFKYNNRNT
jgi:hypothetical protein